MRRRLALAAAAAALLAGISGAGIALAAGDDEGRVTGPEADAAVAAALQATGGGRANAVERDSEDGATWEVEVTRPDGSTVDVRLDEKYEVVVIDGDSEGADSESSDKDGEH
jgi:hypothetical protein